MENSKQAASGQSSLRIILLVIVVLVLVAVVWYLKFYQAPPKSLPITTPSASLNPAITSPTSTLGGQIYQQTQNPIQNKLPGTVAPVPNPLQKVYKNPFD